MKAILTFLRIQPETGVSGIDIHAAAHWVAVPAEDAPAPANQPPNLPAQVPCFGACTADLIALRSGATDAWRWRWTSEALAMARYNPDGILDTTFGTGGQVVSQTLIVGGTLRPGIALQGDGRIVVAGPRCW